jgi:polygalacturonase
VNGNFSSFLTISGWTQNAHFGIFWLTLINKPIKRVISAQSLPFLAFFCRFSSTKTHKLIFLGTETSGDISTTWIPDYIFVKSRIQLRELTFQHTEITNLRFYFQEFTTSTSWIHDLNCTEFMISIFKSRIYDFNFMNSQINDFNCKISRF